MAAKGSTEAIILRSLKSRHLRLQIRAGHGERVPGSKVKDFTHPIYVEFSAGYGQVTLRQMQRIGVKDRDEMLERLRNHKFYGSSFVFAGKDAEAATEPASPAAGGGR